MNADYPVRIKSACLSEKMKFENDMASWLVKWKLVWRGSTLLYLSINCFKFQVLVPLFLYPLQKFSVKEEMFLYWW